MFDRFDKPYGVAVASDGSVYATNIYGFVRKFNAAGSIVAEWGAPFRTGSGDREFYWPQGIATSGGFVYVADSGNNRIQKLGSNGNFVAKWGSYGSGNGQFIWPAGVAIAVDGSIYVADTGNHRIQKFDGSGNFITKWGALCSTDNNWDGIPDKAWNGGLFNYPAGIAASPDGFIYVTDYNNRI